MTFEELRKYYSENFSLGYLNPPETSEHSSFERKIMLILMQSPSFE